MNLHSGGGRSRISVLALTAVVTLLLVATAAGRAVDGLPRDIPPAERARLQDIVDGASVSTHVTAEPFAAHPAVFEYLLDHPDFATHVTRALKAARYRIWSTTEGYALDDGWGASGLFSVVHARRSAQGGSRIMYAKGQYDHRFLPPIKGQAVVIIEYAFRRGEDGSGLVAQEVTGFVKLDSRVWSMAGRVAGPAARAKADLEGQRLIKAFAKVSREINADPAGVYARVRERPDVPRRELEEFRRLLRLP